MQTINDISALLINIIRAGLGFRVIYCCIRLMSADEEQGTYKRRIRNSLIAVAVNELVWVIKDLVISYFNLIPNRNKVIFLRSVMNSYDKIIHSRRSENKIGDI